MTTPAAKTILVTGATGRQGSAVISALQSLGPSSAPFTILALTRDSSSRSAQRLVSTHSNVVLIEGSLANPTVIFAGRPIWGVFSVQVNSDDEETQGKALVDAAVAHGVRHFVYASGDRGGPVASEQTATSVKNFAAKFAIERHLIAAAAAAASTHDMAYTILRPVTFFDNLTLDVHGKGFARMWQQLGDKRLQLVATRDVGWFAAQAFARPEAHRNVAMTLVGDELTQPEADVIFHDVVGSHMAMAPCLVGSAVKFVKKDTVGDMFKWFAEEGYGGSVEECRRTHPAMQDFRTWLKESSPFVESAQGTSGEKQAGE